jgi:hypothetical protein
MDLQFVCPDCGTGHSDPGDARLGHLVICLECAIALDDRGSELAPESVSAPIAA